MPASAPKCRHHSSATYASTPYESLIVLFTIHFGELQVQDGRLCHMLGTVQSVHRKPMQDHR